MRFPYVGVLASLLPVIACATGEEIGKGKVQLIDAGHHPDETGGDPGDLGSGGEVGSGGMGSGGMPARGGMQSVAGSNSGGKASGGMPATGGKAGGGTSGGGTSGSGGSAAGGKGGASTGGAPDPGDAGSCKTGEKFCGGVCTPPAPRVGCGTSGCDPCALTAPANGYITCTNNQCAFDCLSGFMKMGNMCTSGGQGGQGGSGNCRPQSCMNCGPVLGPGCCTQAGKCGCPLIPYVAPTCI